MCMYLNPTNNEVIVLIYAWYVQSSPAFHPDTKWTPGYRKLPCWFDGALSATINHIDGSTQKRRNALALRLFCVEPSILYAYRVTAIRGWQPVGFFVFGGLVLSHGFAASLHWPKRRRYACRLSSEYGVKLFNVAGVGVLTEYFKTCCYHGCCYTTVLLKYWAI